MTSCRVSKYSDDADDHAERHGCQFIHFHIGSVLHGGKGRNGPGYFDGRDPQLQAVFEFHEEQAQRHNERSLYILFVY